MEQYPALKRKEILTEATTWMNLEDIMLREISQSQKDQYCVIPLILSSQNCQIYRDREQKRGYQGLGEGDREFHGDRVSVWEDEEVLEMDGDDGCTTM